VKNKLLSVRWGKTLKSATAFATAKKSLSFRTIATDNSGNRKNHRPQRRDTGGQNYIKSVFTYLELVNVLWSCSHDLVFGHTTKCFHLVIIQASGLARCATVCARTVHASLS